MVISGKMKSLLPPCMTPNDCWNPFKIKIIDQKKSRNFFSKLDFWFFGRRFFFQKSEILKILNYHIQVIRQLKDKYFCHVIKIESYDKNSKKLSLQFLFLFLFNMIKKMYFLSILMIKFFFRILEKI